MQELTSEWASAVLCLVCAGALGGSLGGCHNSSVIGAGSDGAAGESASGGSGSSKAATGSGGSADAGGSAAGGAGGAQGGAGGAAGGVGGAGGGVGGAGGAAGGVGCPGELESIFADPDSDPVCNVGVWAEQLATTADEGAIAAFSTLASPSVVTTTRGDLDGPNQGGRDVSVRQYEANGDLRWSSQFGSAADDTAESVEAGREGEVWVAGYTGGVLAMDDELARYDGGDMYLTLFSSEGTRLWTRQLGAARQLEGRLHGPLEDGSMLFVGRVEGAWLGNPDPGYLASYAASFDTQGNLVWSTLLAADAGGRFSDARVGLSGELLAVGEVTLPSGARAPTLLRIDPHGNETARETLPLQDRAPLTLDQGEQGELLIVSVDASALFQLSKLSPDGSLVWERELGADSRAVRALPDGRVVLLNHAGLGVTLLDSDGNVLSEVMLGAAATIAYSVDVWPLDGSLLFAGQTLDRLNGKVYSTGTDAFAFKLRASSLLPSN